MERHGESGAEDWQDLVEVLNTQCRILSFRVQEVQGRLPRRKLQGVIANILVRAGTVQK